MMRTKREAIKHILIVILFGFAALGQVSSQEGVPETAENQSSSQELIDAAHRLSDLSQLGSYVLEADVHVETEINGRHDGRLAIYRDHEFARFEIQFGQTKDFKVQTKHKTYLNPEFSFMDAIGLDGFDHSWDPGHTENPGWQRQLRLGKTKRTKVHNIELRCIETEFKLTTPAARNSLCFDPQRPVLMSSTSAGRRTEFLDYRPQGPVLLPSQVKIHGAPLSLEINHINVVQKPLDSKLFLPPANSLELARCENQQPPKALYTPEPSYSEVARSKSIQGMVVLGVLIDKNGKVANARVLIPVDPDLDWRAKGAVQGWKFKPSTCGGRPVEAAMTVEVLFRLN